MIRSNFSKIASKNPITNECSLFGILFLLYAFRYSLFGIICYSLFVIWYYTSMLKLCAYQIENIQSRRHFLEIFRILSAIC